MVLPDFWQQFNCQRYCLVRDCTRLETKSQILFPKTLMSAEDSKKLGIKHRLNYLCSRHYGRLASEEQIWSGQLKELMCDLDLQRRYLLVNYHTPLFYFCLLFYTILKLNFTYLNTLFYAVNYSNNLTIFGHEHIV